MTGLRADGSRLPSLGAVTRIGATIGALAAATLGAADWVFACVLGVSTTTGELFRLAAAAVGWPAILGGLIGGFIALWLRLVVGRARSPAATRAWSVTSRAALPWIAFALWVPSSWIGDNWRTLVGWQRGAVVSCLFIILALSLLTARLVSVAWGQAGAPARGQRSPLYWPCVGAAFGLGAAAYMLDRRLLVGLYPEFHIGLTGLTLASVGVGLALCARRAVGPGEPLVARAGVAALALVFLSSLTTASVGPPSSHRGTVILPKILSLAMDIADLDGDGYPGWFVGPDCDDLAADVSPGAIDIPRNGADEDCFEGDARWPAPLPPPPETTPAEKPLNVLLITIDALRADHVGGWGYERDTTPNMDKLARTSTLFLNAYAQATKTSYSLPSLLTGLYPSNLPRLFEHRSLAKAKKRIFHLGDAVTLPEALRDANYTTVAFASVGILRRIGLDRRFSRTRFGATQKESRRFLLRKAKPPFVMWVHLAHPHDPYQKHAGLDFGDEDIDRYDSEVAMADRVVGTIVAALKQRRLFEKTIIVITADHGEEFGEHGGRYHGSHLHRELLHVPLLLRVPGSPAARVSGGVELVDVVPTLRALLGREDPRAPTDGVSLWPTGGRHRQGILGTYAEVVHKQYVGMRSLATDKWKLISHRGGMHELFDLERDAGEQRNVSRDHPDVVRQLREAMAQRGQRHAFAMLQGARSTEGLKRLADGLHLIQNPVVLAEAVRLLQQTDPEAHRQPLHRLLTRERLPPSLRATLLRKQ